MTVPRVVHVWQTLFQHIYIYDQRLCCKWFTFYDSAQSLTDQIANSFHWLAHTSDADQTLWEHCKLLYAVIYSSCLLVTQQKNSKHANTVWSASFCFNFSCRGWSHSTYLTLCAYFISPCMGTNQISLDCYVALAEFWNDLQPCQSGYRSYPSLLYFKILVHACIVVTYAVIDLW